MSIFSILMICFYFRYLQDYADSATLGPLERLLDVDGKRAVGIAHEEDDNIIDFDYMSVLEGMEGGMVSTLTPGAEVSISGEKRRVALCSYIIDEAEGLSGVWRYATWRLVLEPKEGQISMREREEQSAAVRAEEAQAREQELTRRLDEMTAQVQTLTAEKDGYEARIAELTAKKQKKTGMRRIFGKSF